MEETVRFVFSERNRESAPQLKIVSANSGDRRLPHDQERS